MRTGRYEESVAKADQALAISERLRLDRITAESMVDKASSQGYMGRLQSAVGLLDDMGSRFALARVGLDMATLLDPAHPSIAAAIERSRRIWGAVGAVAWLERLDQTLEARAAEPSRPGLRPETHPVA